MSENTKMAVKVHGLEHHLNAETWTIASLREHLEAEHGVTTRGFRGKKADFTEWHEEYHQDDAEVTP